MDRQSQKLPRNYALIRDIVRTLERGAHYTAHDFYRIARERQPGIGYATVFRGLARLVELGDVMKIELAGGDAAWYEPETAQHAHLQCRACARLVDVDYAVSRRARAELARAAGIRIDSVAVTFRGLCVECRTSVPGKHDSGA